MKSYGKELILDLHGCSTPFDRKSIKKYLTELCDKIDMTMEDLHFWDYDGDPDGYKNAPPHLKGISVVQFIRTSSIVLHTLDDLKKVFINVFSCKDFDELEVETFTRNYFGGEVVNRFVVERI